MEQYGGNGKDLIDYILAIDDKLNDIEQIIYVLGGLDINYTSLVTSITSKKIVISLDEVFTRMSMHERQHDRMTLPNQQLRQAHYSQHTKPFAYDTNASQSS